MKLKYCITLILIPFLMATECRRNNFFPDPDDPSLSRFTSRGYNVATNYINGMAFHNTGPYNLLQKDSSNSATDTLKFGWQLYTDFLSGPNYPYQNISFLIPVSSVFNKIDLLAFNNKRFSNLIPVVIQETQDSSSKLISGNANLYFVSVMENLSYMPQKYIKLSGLFDGNIGDTVLITKGRFDFEINESDLNF